MNVIQGKLKDKKVVIAQEIAFAKVLAGNNKTLRDRAVKKLRKWLTVRGNGKWAFTEDEFIRIWTGLFYCMWMSDKFLVQEELAESISSLIHCFKKNSDNALLFVKCFNKRILMDWEGLDQYRIDKFNMLIRRFLRQTLIYCREKDWDATLLQKLMEIFYNIVLHRDNSLGFVLQFINIYAEELAKVSKGQLEAKTVVTLIEPFVKLLSRTKDSRIQKETEEFFMYLMRQTDTGIEFEEKFNAWKEQGFPGEGPHCMEDMSSINENHEDLGNGDVSFSEEEEEKEDFDEPLDPRAGSVHVFLPQIPIDIDAIIALLQKHQNSKQTTPKGKRIIKNLCDKFGTLKAGHFPEKIKKDPILEKTKRDRRQTKKNARELLKFTQQIDEGPIKTKEFEKMSRELEEQDLGDSENRDEESENETEAEDVDEEIESAQVNIKNRSKTKNILSKKQKKLGKVHDSGEEIETDPKKVKLSKDTSNKKIRENINHKENREQRGEQEQEQRKKKRKNRKRKEKNSEMLIADEEIVVVPKNKQKVNGMTSESFLTESVDEYSSKVTPVNKTGTKRKILSNWQVQELDSSSPEYYKIETPKIIRLEKKVSQNSTCEDEEPEKTEEKLVENEWKSEETPKQEIFPVFWEKARAKVNKKSARKSGMFMNPFANIQAEFKSSPGRRISFALDKNMAQENEEYLEEVKNSPRVPFDGSKKPVQSALKSGLAPSPVNPFYRFKKIKF